jgi:integrase
VKQLFPVNWESVWEGDHLCYAANKLAACMGMRIGEILGLRGEYVFEDYIHVHAQYDEYGYRPMKTKETRNIPLALVIMGELRRLMERNGRGFLFSLDGGAAPVNRMLIYKKVSQGAGENRDKQGGDTTAGLVHAQLAAFFQHNFTDGECGVKQGTVGYGA